MNTAQIIAEFRKLSRPSIFLAAANPGEPILAIWGGGRGAVPPPEGAWNHQISVDCAWLAKNGFEIKGCLSVYERNNAGDGGDLLTVVSDPAATLPVDETDGVALSGMEQPSFPPLEDICSSGSSIIEHRLKALGVTVDDLWKKEFRRSKEADRYDQDYHEHCPLELADTEGIFAVLGGWHLMWPDDDAYEREGRLALWTFRDAPKYLEVWQLKTGELKVMPRTS